MPVVRARIVRHHDEPPRERRDPHSARGEILGPELEVTTPCVVPVGVRIDDRGETPVERSRTICIEVRVEREVPACERHLRPRADEVGIRDETLDAREARKEIEEGLAAELREEDAHVRVYGLEALLLELPEARRLFVAIDPFIGMIRARRETRDERGDDLGREPIVDDRVRERTRVRERIAMTIGDITQRDTREEREHVHRHIRRTDAHSRPQGDAPSTPSGSPDKEGRGGGTVNRFLSTLALGAFLVGCADSAPVLDTGVPNDTQVDQLTDAQARQICERAETVAEDVFGVDVQHELQCVAGGIAADALNISTCKASYNDCIAEPFTGEPVDFDCGTVTAPMLANCNATVGELEACANAQLRLVNGLISEVDCGLADDPARLEQILADLEAGSMPEACASLPMDCPIFFGDMSMEGP
jgi:hypothetical protein